MASYQGSPFEAGIGPTDNDIVLFAACPPPEELGFEPATGHWRRQLRIHEVQASWEPGPGWPGRAGCPRHHPGGAAVVARAPGLDGRGAGPLPVTTEAPLPLEAEPWRAASASRRPHSAQTGPTPHPSQPPAAFQAGQT